MDHSVKVERQNLRIKNTKLHCNLKIKNNVKAKTQ